MSAGRRALIPGAVLVVLLLLVAGRVVSGTVSELFWYRSLGRDAVFWTQLRAGVLVRGTLALLIGAMVYGNLMVVARSLSGIRLRRRYGNIEIAERLPRAYVVTAAAGVALFSAYWLSAAAGDSISVLAALDPEPFGVTDPIFGRDAAYYVFQWPVLRRLHTLAALMVLWIAMIAVAAYVLTGAIKVIETRLTISPLARRHLGMLAAFSLVLYAVHLWLSRYGLLISGNGFAGALGYTDATARLPAKLILLLISVVTAAAVGYALWVGRSRLAVPFLALLSLAWVVGGTVYPSLVQRFSVEPNELLREEPYIGRHIEFARLGYDLADVEEVPLPYSPRIELDEAALLEGLRGVPLWDPRPLLITYRQRQALYRYYSFTSVHHDRYPGPNGVEPVAIAVRELETPDLEETAQTWQNLHLNYVSGEGVVVSPVARMATDGTPIFYLWDIDPPKVAPDAPSALTLRNPEIYFGERTTEYVILPDDASPTGVPLDATWKKILFAWAFQSKNILLSGDLTRNSKLVYRRQVVDRVRAVAPFLAVPSQGGNYPVIIDGRVVWIVDAYTASSTFPLSPLREFGGRGRRYIRNSVKATVDALTGEVELYAVDPTDPLLITYGRLFPGLIRPIDEMPEGLQRHLRFPAGLMELQALVAGAYHLDDARLFYEQQDVWALAQEQYQATPVTMAPTYSIFSLPGSAEPEFVLSVPLVPRGRQNMTALMVTRNDPPNYGQQILYLMPRDEVVFGPQQIEAMIDQDPEISQELALWRRGRSDVTRGHLMVVPIDGGLVYVEPLFLEATSAAIPQLERVILATSGRVVMGSTFEAAVADLLGGGGASAGSSRGGPAEWEPVVAPSTSIMDTARRLMSQADAALRSGDWAGFGRSWEQLRELLDRDF